jgi:hypothetical protein
MKISKLSVNLPTKDNEYFIEIGNFLMFIV